METAEEFAARLVTHLADTLIAPSMSPREAKTHAIALIEADRAAVALAAKRELLEELTKQAHVCENNASFGRPSCPESYCAAHGVLRRKYGCPLR
jgi:hypothetical protein